MSDWNKEFGGRLKKSREKAILTQKETAAFLKISQPTYSQYESGARLPSLEVFLQLVRVLAVSADYLLTGTSKDDLHLDTDTVQVINEYKAMQPKDRSLFLELLRLLRRYA